MYTPVNPSFIYKSGVKGVSILYRCVFVMVSRNVHIHKKKGKRKVQGVSQSQTAALPRHQEEEETDKSKQAKIEQTYEKH